MQSFSRAALLVAVSLLTACGGSELAKNPKQDAVIAMAGKEGSLMRLANATRAGGDLKTAAQLYEQAIAGSKDSVAPHLALADLYEEIGKAQLAVGVLRDAEKLQPQNTEVLRALGNALVSVGEPAQAVDVFDRAATVDAADARLYNGKGVALDMTGDYAGAQQAYQQAIDADAKDEDSYIKNNLALSYLMNDRFNEAIDVLQPLLLQGNPNPTIRQNLALAYGLKGDRDKAMKLGIKDLTKEQAEENLAFYEMYLKSRKAMPAKLEKSQSAAPVVASSSKEIAPLEKEQAAKPTPVKEPVAQASGSKPLNTLVKPEPKEAPVAKVLEEPKEAPVVEEAQAPVEEDKAVSATPVPRKNTLQTRASQPRPAPVAEAPAEEPAIEAEQAEAPEEPVVEQQSEPAAGTPAPGGNKLPTRNKRYDDEWTVR